MNIIQIIFYCIGIVFMLTFMFIGIWSFIIYNKMYRAKRIHNYILEKIYQHISKNSTNHHPEETPFDINSLLEDDEFFSEDKTN